MKFKEFSSIYNTHQPTLLESILIFDILYNLYYKFN